MGNVTFTLGEGGLGRALPGEDHISGLLFQNASLPSGFGASAREKRVTSLAEAEALGITVAAGFPVEHYHVSEFFRAAPKGILWIGIYAISTGTYAGTEVRTLQDAAGGKIRQMGVFLVDTFTTADITQTQTVAAQAATDKKPLSVLFAADMSATDIATLLAGTDPRTLSSPRVSVVFGEDGGGVGAALAVSEGYSITTLGHTLGTVAAASVHENIGWVGKFNASDGTELETLNFATGEAWADQTAATLASLKTAGYLFLNKVTGKTGSFYDETPTCTVITSDYAYIENQRTIDKATRQIYANVIDLVNSPLYVNATTGKLSESTIALFRNETLKPIEQMAADGELSSNDDGSLPETTVTIDPDQDVLTSSQIDIVVRLVPVGVARTIAVTIGFTVNVN